VKNFALNKNHTVPKWWKTKMASKIWPPCVSYYYWRVCCVLSEWASCPDIKANEWEVGPFNVRIIRYLSNKWSL